MFHSLILILIVLAGSLSFAIDRRAPIFGHNLTHTSNTLTEHSCGVGLQAIACRVTDDFAVGTSPFLLLNYSMANGYFRYKFYKNKEVTHAMEFAFFQTFKDSDSYRPDGDWDKQEQYKQTSAQIYYIRTVELSDTFRWHVNGQMQYFWDDTYPFSIRRPDPSRTPWQFNATMLMEVNLTYNFFLQGETGFLGLNYHYPQLHSGATIGYRDENFVVHIGMSVTGTISGLWRPFYRRDWQKHMYQLDDGSGKYRYDAVENYHPSMFADDYSLHPELGVQYYF